jgi:hypothetical protein
MRAPQLVAGNDGEARIYGAATVFVEANVSEMRLGPEKGMVNQI